MPPQAKLPSSVPPGYSQYFVLIAGVFITCLITANITAVKLIQVFGLTVPAAIIIFPISYIVGDVLTEVYGYRQARLTIWLGFFCNLIAVVAIWLGQVLPAASFWDGQAAYERILGYTPRLLAASFLAYLVGEFAGAGFPRLHHAGLRRDDPAAWAALRHRDPVAGQVGLRGGGHAPDVSRGEFPEAARGAGRL
jgi:hypothetical protein